MAASLPANNLPRHPSLFDFHIITISTIITDGHYFRQYRHQPNTTPRQL